LILGLVELLIRLADQLVGRQRLVAVGGGQADADRHRVGFALVLEDVLLDQGTHPLSHADAAFQVRLRQHDDELLAAVAGKQLFLADAALDAGSQLAEREVAAQVAQLVVDALETIQVEHDQRQRPAVTGRARQLPVQELQQVALVVDVGQGVDDGQAVDFLVVLRLDVAAGQEAIDAVSDPQVVAVLELADRRGNVVDEGAVGALQIDRVVAVRPGLDTGVAARYGMVVNADVAVVAAAQDHGRVSERITGSHPGPGRINVDNTGVPAGGRDQPIRRGYPGFVRFLHVCSHGSDQRVLATRERTGGQAVRRLAVEKDGCLVVRVSPRSRLSHYPFDCRS